MPSLRVAAITLTASADKASNIRQAETYVREAARLGADWVVLPEIFHFHGPYSLLWDMAEEEGGPLFQTMSRWARDLKVCLFGGTIGERPTTPDESKRVFNTHYVFNRSGICIGKYQKIHLFNLLDERGQKIYCESDGFVAGNEVQSVTLDGLHVGLSICYDIRFSGLFLAIEKRRPLDVIVCPAAFTMKTGKDHWELLTRARAIEHQCYVLAANQTGVHSPGKESYGQSMVIDPWGTKLADTGEPPGIALASIDSERIDAVRRQLPALANRRADLERAGS